MLREESEACGQFRQYHTFHLHSGHHLLGGLPSAHSIGEHNGESNLYIPHRHRRISQHTLHVTRTWFCVAP